MTRLESFGGSLGGGLESCDVFWVFKPSIHRLDLTNSHKDLARARVNPACVQYVSIVPSAVAAFVVGYYVLQSLLPAKPLWLRRFAAEDSKYNGELRNTGKAWTLWTVLLLLSTALGLTISIISALSASQSSVGALSVAPWVWLPSTWKKAFP